MSKGSTSYGNVSSLSSSEYPSNNYSGEYWYTSLGSDSIDAESVSYDEAEVKPGAKITITITPSSETTLGGTISYLVETNADEGGWEQVSETTERTAVVTIPETAVAWRIRVRAKDDTGYTSDTYIYGNKRSETPSEVIYPATFSILPKGKDLGILTSNTILIYTVTSNKDSSYRYTVKLDDQIIRSGMQATGVSSVTLTGDEWEAIGKGVHTLVFSAAGSETSSEETYTFQKFLYSTDTLAGLFDGIANAIRMKRGTSSSIAAKDFPKEVLKIVSAAEMIKPSYIKVTVEYSEDIKVIATDGKGNSYEAASDQSGVTTIEVDHTGPYTVTAYKGGIASSSAVVTIENDGDTVET